MHRKPIRFSTIAVMLAVILLMMILSRTEAGRTAHACLSPFVGWTWAG